MEVNIDLQIATDEPLESYPSLEKMTLWAKTALITGGRTKDSELILDFILF